MEVLVEFSGGLEGLFGNRKQLSLPLSQGCTVEDLISILKERHLAERAELFIQGNSVRPGILVLINEVDWELEGRLRYKLVDGDSILFISTLHGG
jgi:ubiquitin related modifier 1